MTRWLKTLALLCATVLGGATHLVAQTAAPSSATPTSPAASDLPALYDRVEIEPTRTSIYIGSIGMTMEPFVRQNGGYASTYHAKVRPYFFYNEHGTLFIEVSNDALQRLRRGEPIEFEGHAFRDDGAKRGIAGRAVPADATSGKIKVRVFVTKKIELIFNTTYRFTGE